MEHEARVGSGSLRPADGTAVGFPHRWTPDGVGVECTFTGAHLLHLAVAGCVLNDVHREAAARGLAVDGVRVCAGGGFDEGAWTSTGVTYRVEVDSPCTAAELADLLAAVDAVAEIPRALRAGVPVERTEHA